MKFMRFRNDDGFTLMEVIMASAIGVVVLLAFASMMTNQSAAAKSISQSLDAVEAERELFEFLSITENCMATFNGRNPNLAGVIPNLRDKTSAVVYTFPRTFGQVEITSVDYLAPAPAIPANSRGEVVLRFNTKKLPIDGVGGALANRNINLFVETNGAGTIAGCSANTVQPLACLTKVSTSSKGTPVYCDPGYYLTGGGMYDSDASKGGNFRSHPLPNGWNCFDDDGGVTQCYAICCKF